MADGGEERDHLVVLKEGRKVFKSVKLSQKEQCFQKHAEAIPALAPTHSQSFANDLDRARLRNTISTLHVSGRFDRITKKEAVNRREEKAREHYKGLYRFIFNRGYFVGTIPTPAPTRSQSLVHNLDRACLRNTMSTLHVSRRFIRMSKNHL